MSIPSRLDITRAVLSAVLDLPVCGVVIYGSIAAGTATTASDLDTLILTSHDLPRTVREQVHADFIALQQRLGLRPDPQYPVELFSLDAATIALATAEAAMHKRCLHELADDSDEREVLRALTGPRWVLCECQQMNDLIRTAEDLTRLTAEALA